MNEENTRLDRMRYTKNTTSSRLAILAIVFDVLFFIAIYKNNGKYFYNILMGASIIYNLVFLLAAFLASEGVKNYKQSYSWLLLALAAGQIIRIFILPMQAHTTEIGGAPVMGDGQFIFLVICLVCSAVCLAAAAVIIVLYILYFRKRKKHFADLVDQKKTMSPVMDEKASENIIKITSKIDGTIGEL